MTKYHTGIAVLEGRWWKDSNVSVRSMFDLISELSEARHPHAYHYEMANSLPAVCEAVPRIMRLPYVRYLCIAMHGDAGKLSLFNKTDLSVPELRTILVDAERARRGRSRCAGLYLSCCLVGTLDIAKYLFDKDNGVTWIAGYEEEVDWLRSSAMDMLFFQELIYAERSTRKRTIREVAGNLQRYAPGLIEELGFGIFIKSKRHDGAQNLFDISEDDD